MNTTLQECLKVAEEAAMAGGRVLLEYRFAPLEITHKDLQEVVTNVDTLADAAIGRVLSRYFPGHSIISEESGTRTSSSPYTWIVDPLDGTESYIRGQNFSSVTVALTSADRTLIGVVYHPFNDELYSAVAGAETTVNGHPGPRDDLCRRPTGRSHRGRPAVGRNSCRRHRGVTTLST